MSGRKNKMSVSELDSLICQLYNEFHKEHGDMLKSKSIETRVDYFRQARLYIDRKLREHQYKT